MNAATPSSLSCAVVLFATAASVLAVGVPASATDKVDLQTASSMPTDVATHPPTAAQWASSEPSYRELLRADRRYAGAVSVGTSVSGRIRGESVEVPEDGDDLAVMEMCRGRGTNFGTEELATLLHDSAAAVAAEAPGARLLFCNLSKKGGRNIPWSHSHNSGRDVDLPFFVVNKGVSTEPTVMMRFRRDLNTGADEDVAFDVARNWVLVKHLLTHPTVQVQWIFVYRHLRRALLSFARAHGEAAETIARAEHVLVQPTDSSPHRDHFHVRIYCTGSDAADGCLNEGPLWPWIEERWREPLSRRAAALSPGFADPDAKVRQAVLALATETRAFGVAPALAGMAIVDPRSSLRLEATDRLVEWYANDGDAMAAIESFVRAPGGGFSEGDPIFEQDLPPAVAADGTHTLARFGRPEGRDALLVKRAYRLIGKIGSRRATPFLTRALKSRRRLDDEAQTPEAQLAARAAQHIMDLDLVPALLDTLETSPNGRVRRSVATALRRVTNHRLGVGWGDGVDEARRARNVASWRRWWLDNLGRGRGELLVRGFRLRGVPVKSLTGEGVVDILLRAVDRPTEVGYNADRVLCELTGHWSPPAMAPAARAKRWTAWRDARPGPIKLRRVKPDEVATFDRHGLSVKKFSWQASPTGP